MSRFKDAITADVKAVFINCDEFGDIHCVNGERVPCVVDTDVTAGADKSFEGVFVNTVTLYIATADIETRPVEGELLVLDERVYIVRKVSDESEMLVITLEVHDQ